MLREISLAEVNRHNSYKSDWIVIHNEVYDVTKYLSEHPGGEDTLLEVAGLVATQSFEDVGHSDDAREIMKKYKIGTLPANEHSIAKREAPIVGDAESWSTTWNREYLVYPAKASKASKSSHQCCGPDNNRDPLSCNQSWRTFDGSTDTKRAPPLTKSPSAPRIERRVNAIVVPRQRTTRRRPRRISRRRSSIAPDSGNWWKWALLLLAGAITVGLIVKKKMA